MGDFRWGAAGVQLCSHILLEYRRPVCRQDLSGGVVLVSIWTQRVGITIHLAAVLPLGLLLPWQFVPLIRHKFILFHRINGYLVLLLLILSNVGALMICRRAMGGAPATQAALAGGAILTYLFAFLAYYNIKRLQIDQHRAWMLRTFFIMGSIITLRPFMAISNAALSRIGSSYAVMSCAEISFAYTNGRLGANDPTLRLYPQCASTNVENYTSNGQVAVHVDTSTPEGHAAAYRLSFSMGLWACVLLHIVGVEIYLRLTPAESERLRIVSYEKQLVAKLNHPGSAGLTVDRFGDAEAWHPPLQTVEDLSAKKKMMT